MLHVIIERPEFVLSLHFRGTRGLDIEIPEQMAYDQSLLNVGQVLAYAPSRSVTERL